MMGNKNIVAYHATCYDGFGAAYAAWTKLGNTADYIPVSYGKPPPDIEPCNTLYIVDFSYGIDELRALMQKARKIVVLDHHKTAEEKLTPLIGKFPEIEIHFDMKRSGALMTWQYFWPDEPIPRLIEHISDRDLWEFKIHGTKEVHSALVSYPMDFEVWDDLQVDRLIEEGETCTRLYQKLVGNICDHLFGIKFAGLTGVPVVNTAIAWSEVGEELLRRAPESPLAMSFTVFGDEFMFSLRSRPGFDATEIAKKYGGGGHKQACGFKAAHWMGMKIINGEEA